MARLMDHDLLKPAQRHQLAQLLLSGLTCSLHSLTAGGRDRSFFNLDEVLACPTRSKQLVDLLIVYVTSIRSKHGVNCLAFIDNSPRGGPAALLACRTALSHATQMPTVIVRPYKRLYIAQVAGPLPPKPRVLFVCDTLTTGTTLAKAVGVCARNQAHVIGAVYVFDRLLQGEQALEKVNIPIEPLTNRREFLRETDEELTSEQRNALKTPADLDAQDLLPLMAAQL